MDISVWKERTEMARRNKGGLFRGYQSPISFEDQERFKGLDYYPPDPEYRLELEAVEHQEKNNLRIEDTKGNIRDFIRWGEFQFEIKGEACVLQIYKANLYEEQLFIPFRDLTSGKETHDAGRYLDLQPYVKGVMDP